MAGNSKDSKILAYKDMINQLNKTISTQTELIQSLQKTLEADRLEKENLHQQIEYLTKKLFSTSSEKRKNIDGQLNLFDEAEQEADPTWEQELPDDITVPEHKRKARRTHADLFKNVPSCDEIISLPEEERNCPTCGTQMECIGKEFVRHEFRFTPAKGKVVNIYRETYKCPECAISEEHPDEQTFVKAPVQDPLIPESYAPLKPFQDRMKAENILVGRPFPPAVEWCRVSLSTPDDMKYFAAKLKEFRRKGWV